MSYLSQNIRYLRKQRELTQSELAKHLGLGKGVISTYEDGKAEPKISTLRSMARFFGCDIHQLIEEQLSKDPTASTQRSIGEDLRILPVVVSQTDDKEQIPLVPVKAAAGYTTGYADPAFVESLPSFSLPFPELSSDRTYRIFQTTGDSMLPVPDGAYIICEYLVDWTQLLDNDCYVVITRNEGLVYKRVVNQLHTNNQLLLISDNPDYSPYHIPSSEIIEIWRARGYTTFNLPSDNKQFLNLQHLAKAIDEIRSDVKVIKER